MAIRDLGLSGFDDVRPILRFSRIAIVGLGLIGGSIALARASAGRRRASSASIARRCSTTRSPGARFDDAGDGARRRSAGADLIVLAAPVRQNIELLRAGRCRTLASGAVVTDVGGTKRAIVDAARALAGRLTFVGGHPIGGGARGGFEFATAGSSRAGPGSSRQTRRRRPTPPRGSSASRAGWGPCRRTMSAADHDPSPSKVPSTCRRSLSSSSADGGSERR